MGGVFPFAIILGHQRLSRPHADAHENSVAQPNAISIRMLQVLKRKTYGLTGGHFARKCVLSCVERRRKKNQKDAWGQIYIKVSMALGGLG